MQDEEYMFDLAGWLSSRRYDAGVRGHMDGEVVVEYRIIIQVEPRQVHFLDRAENVVAVHRRVGNKPGGRWRWWWVRSRRIGVWVDVFPHTFGVDNIEG